MKYKKFGWVICKNNYEYKYYSECLNMFAHLKKNVYDFAIDACTT